MPERLCIYRGHRKSEQEFTLEHILPRAIGGSLATKIFQSEDVCGDCNHTCGLFVDGAFLKGFFRTNEDAIAARQYLDLSSDSSILPFAYMGVLESMPLADDEVCEIWIGACGERVYHFHQKDDSRYDTFAGGDPIRRKKKKDAGRAYLKLTSEKESWTGLALRSFANGFARTRRYAVNFAVQGQGTVRFVEEPDTIAQRELELIRTLGDGVHKHRIALDIHFEQRFLAKLAIGVGYNVLGPLYLESAYAQLLRAALWKRDPKVREEIPLRGTGFPYYSPRNIDEQFVAWLGAYTILLKITGSNFALTLYTPSQRGMHIVLSDDSRLWPDAMVRQYVDGQIYLSLPQIPKFVGPIWFPAYVSHRIGSAPVEDLVDLERRRIDVGALPPCR